MHAKAHVSSPPGNKSSAIHLEVCARAFTVAALCVHFSGAGPGPSAGLLLRSHRQFILPAADKQNLPKQ